MKLLLVTLVILVGLGFLAVIGITRHRAKDFHTIYIGCILASTVMLTGGIEVLFGVAEMGEMTLPLGLIEAHFRLDPLAAFFLVVVNTTNLLVSYYALGHNHLRLEPQRILPFYPWFLACMNLLLIADDTFLFLIAWSLLSVNSWLLILASHRQTENQRAAHLTLLMAGLSAAALLLCFSLLVGPTGDPSFDNIRERLANDWIEPRVVHWAIALALLGTGAKVGIFPLHIWSPPAHAAAPSFVAALMSSSMSSVTLYAMIRLLFDLIGAIPWGWGVAMTISGSITAVTGLLYAIVQPDLKKLLACHTVGTMGIIIASLGLAILFLAGQLPWLAALALSAALLHCLNHALSKSLLFCGAGAIRQVTGQKNLDRLGGLIHQLPRTAKPFLVGCAAIATLPPLNGFVSWWLLLQAVLLTPQATQWLGRLSGPLAGLLLMTAGTLSVACFVKVFGILFLGSPRSQEAATPTKVPAPMVGTLLLFATLCLAIGLFPMVGLEAIATVTRQLVDDVIPLASDNITSWWRLIPLPWREETAYSPLPLTMTLAILLLATHVLVRSLAPHPLPARRLAPTWNGGLILDDPATQYTASSLTQPIRRIHAAAFLQITEEVKSTDPGLPGSARFTLVQHDPVWERFVAPAVRWVQRSADLCNRIQTLPLRLCLAMTFITLIILLVITAWGTQT